MVDWRICVRCGRWFVAGPDWRRFECGVCHKIDKRGLAMGTMLEWAPIRLETRSQLLWTADDGRHALIYDTTGRPHRYVAGIGGCKDALVLHTLNNRLFCTGCGSLIEVDEGGQCRDVVECDCVECSSYVYKCNDQANLGMDCNCDCEDEERVGAYCADCSDCMASDCLCVQDVPKICEEPSCSYPALSVDGDLTYAPAEARYLNPAYTAPVGASNG